MAQDRADAFLRMIRRTQRGRLKVYLGYAAGVGKTYQMLQEARRLKEEGIDLVVGLVETHGREDTARLLEGLEVVPRQRRNYRGIVAEEMDLDAVLRRKPQVAIVDELAHTNVPGSRNDKRYEDVQDLLAAGIHVISTLNVQHLESLFNTVEQTTGVKVRERLPDGVLAEADQIVNVDITPEDLHERLKAGKVYPTERINTALENFFRAPNLENLRELTLREIAAQIDLRRHDLTPEDIAVVPDQVMVCLSSRGPKSEMLLRYASRMAGKLNRNWYAVYVQTPAEEATVIDAGTQRLLSGTLTLAKELGAMVFTYKGEDIADTVARFAKEYRVGHIVMGTPAPVPFLKRLLGKKNVIERILDKTRNITVVMLDTREEKGNLAEEDLAAVEESQTAGFSSRRQGATSATGHLLLSHLVSEDRIVIWNEPTDKRSVIERLVSSACRGQTEVSAEECLQDILKREEQGTTFFNEGVAFPHARVEGLTKPLTALGLAREGIGDIGTDRPIGYVFLILAPAYDPQIQLELLAAGARSFQNRYLLKELDAAVSPAAAYDAIRQWENSSLRAPAGKA
ncbi:MAG: PTS sugar transporter subunit IIA [Smithellaceae bacterium]|nr:PTS sugar transporter subunit IIA [Smithellaceae bacterium]